MTVQPAVKEETIKVAAATAAGTAVMIAAFGILHQVMPETVPFNYKVVLGAAAGLVIAVLNFFWMGMTVQQVVSLTDEDRARGVLRVSFRNRMLMQMLFVILALAAPVFNGAAAIIPLFIPSIYIKLRGVGQAVSGMNSSAGTGETAGADDSVQTARETETASETESAAETGTAKETGKTTETEKSDTTQTAGKAPGEEREGGDTER